MCLCDSQALAQCIYVILQISCVPVLNCNHQYNLFMNDRQHKQTALVTQRCPDSNWLSLFVFSQLKNF